MNAALRTTLSTVVLSIAVMGIARPVPAAETVQSMLDARALQGAYNPVLLSFLTEEGRTRLTEAQRKAALEQLVAGFKQQIKITPGAQVTASLATLAGLLTKGAVGQGISEGAAGVWSTWVDAAFVLQKAGYKEESTAFFLNCVQNFPYEGLQTRCAVGLANADPDKAFSTLVDLLDGKKYAVEVNATALRLLGDLAATPGLPPEKKDAVIDELTKRTHGFSNISLNAAAVDGLIRSRDPRAVETIRKFTKGMMKEEELKRSALRGLLLNYDDAGAQEALLKQLKGGFMKEPKDQVWAALILIEGDKQPGYDWALQYVTGKKKGDVDYTDELVEAMIDRGGDHARDALAKVLSARKQVDWMSARIAIALLDLGDDSRLDLVKAALANKDWPFTRVQAAVALARHKDGSGLPVLRALSEPEAAKSFFKSAVDLALKDKSRPDPAAVRSGVARALGAIGGPEVVPVLTGMLDDPSDRVRLSAAYALASMKDPAALDGLLHALDVDFGKEDNRSRAPEMKAVVVRAAALHFEKEPRTRALLKKAADSEIVSVKFLALAETRGAASEPAASEGAAKPSPKPSARPAARKPSPKTS